VTSTVIERIIIGIVLLGPLFWLAWKVLPTGQRDVIREIRRVPLATVDRLVDGQRVRVFGIARKRELEVRSLYTRSPCLADVIATRDAGDPLVDKAMVAFTLETDDGLFEVAETKSFSLAGITHRGTTDGSSSFTSTTTCRGVDRALAWVASAISSCATAFT
jgi:hypothetical protein